MPRIEDIRLLKEEETPYAHQECSAQNLPQTNSVQEFYDRSYLKAQTALRTEASAFPSLIQMNYYFADLESITCPVSCVATVSPVKLIYQTDQSVSKQVFDGTVINNIIKRQGKCPLTRQEVNDYIESYLPPFLEEFKTITNKNICKKTDITEHDKKTVAEFINNYLFLNLDPDNIIIAGCNLLYVAAKFGLTAQVIKLLNKGINPDQSQGFSYSSDHHFLPLGVCATLNHAEVALALLDHATNRANVNATPDNGEYYGVSAVYFASRFSHKETLEVLVSHSARFDQSASYKGLTALYDAVIRKDFGVIKEILKSRYLEIDQLQTKENGHKGLTALFLAVQEGEVEIAKLLLDAGANPFIKQGAGEYVAQTIFDITLNESEIELKELLVKAKLKAQSKDKALSRPYLASCSASQSAITPLLEQQLHSSSRVLSLRNRTAPVQGRIRMQDVAQVSLPSRPRAWR